MKKLNEIILILLVVGGRNCFGDVNDNSSNDNKLGKLIFAHVIFRHGDRTPVEPYPNDPWKDRSYWPEGFGQLTNIGKQQHYALGQYFRKRYGGLLSTNDGYGYSRENIYIQSTDVDRTLMSALANLAGLFQPIDEQIWNPNLLWQPIPVHTVPENSDYILAAKKPCQLYDFALKKYKDSSEYKDLNKKFKSLYEYLEKNSGKKIRSFTDVQNLYNTLYIEELKNRTLPDWTKSVYPSGDMKWIATRSFQTGTITPQLARLKSGFLLREILNRFTQKTKSKLTPNRSLWIYSAHDTTVANVLNTLGLFELHSPPYTASIMLELYKHNDMHYVEIYYKNTTVENLQPLNIPNCGTSCPLESLYDLYKAVIPDGDFETECNLSLLQMTYAEADLDKFKFGTFFVICFMLLLMLVTVAVWKMYWNNYYRNSKWYLKL